MAFGTFIAIWHFKEEILPLENDPRYGVTFTPYTKWFELGAISRLNSLFFLLLPIIASIPFADTYLKDKQTGFLLSVFSRGHIKDYFTKLFLTNYLVSGLVVTFPLILNVYLAFMFLPNISPDPVVNDLTNISSLNTLFPDLYYNYPFFHILIYIFIAFLFAGLYASISLSVSLYLNNRFIVILFPFIVQMFLSMFYQLIGKSHLDPTSMIQQLSGYLGVTFSGLVLTFVFGMIICIGLYIFGVKKLVIQ